MKSTQERIDNINEKLNAERRIKSRRNKIVISVCSCAAALVLVFGLVLFLPFPAHNVAAYRNSEYYSLICKLDELDASQRPYKNNFDRLTASVGDFFDNFACGSAKGDAGEAPPSSDDMNTSADPNGNYEEVTNNQVNGVIEGDLFKRTDKNIYYLSCDNENYRLDVYPLAGMSTKKSAQIMIAPDKNMRFAVYSSRRELFLSADGGAAFVITPSYDKKNGILYTAVIGIDLAGETPTETGRVYVSGDHVTSRLVNGKLLLVSNFNVKQFKYSDEKLFLPQTGALNSLKSVPMDNIVIPDDAQATRYTVLCSVDTGTLEVTGSAAFLSYSQEVYVSENHIYTTYSHTRKDESGYTIFWTNDTLVSCVAYTPAFELKGSIDVEGRLNDRYSMDEHDGVFRIFTTTRNVLTGRNNASLFCYSLEDFSMIASVRNFAPDGETVRSARFRGDTAYVCTAIQLTDPVFAFDLSDYENITSTDTGTISGYSLYLIPFSDDSLLGIGVGDNGALKLEIYDDTGDGILSLARYETINYNFASEFKSYHIDKEYGTVGLTVYDYDTNKYTYFLWQYDGYRFTQPEKIVLATQDEPNETRGTIVDGVFYLFGSHSGLHLLEIR